MRKIFFVAVGLVFTSSVFAEIKSLDPQLKYVCDSQKNYTSYRTQGVIDCGDSSVKDVVIHDLRFGKMVKKDGISPYERVVFDIEGGVSENNTSRERQPYTFTSVSPDKQRIEITFMGNPQLGMDPKKISGRFAKSVFIKKVELLPVLEKDRWTLVLHLRPTKKKIGVEVVPFYQPLRMSFDLAEVQK